MLTLPQALQRLTHPVMQGIIKTVVTTDQMASIMPIVPINGDAIRFPREGDLPAGGEYIPDTGVTTEESTGSDDRTTVEFRRLVGNMDVDSLANVLSGGAHQASKFQSKVKATWRKVSSSIVYGNYVTSHALTPATGNPSAAIGASATYSPSLDSARRGPGSIKYTHTGTLWQFRAPGDPDYGPAVAVASNGTHTLYSYNKSKWIRVTITVASATADGEVHIRFVTTTNEFDGLNNLVDPAMTIDPVGTDGDDYSFAKLDRMLSLVKIRENMAFVLPGILLEKHYAAVRALGGTAPEHVEIPSVTGVHRVPAYRGVPLLVNDYILATETVGSTTDASSMYLGSFSAEEGVFLGASSYGGSQLMAEADPRNVPVLGFHVTNVGALEGKDANRTRISWIGAACVKSPLALARAHGLKTA